MATICAIISCRSSTYTCPIRLCKKRSICSLAFIFHNFHHLIYKPVTYLIYCVLVSLLCVYACLVMKLSCNTLYLYKSVSWRKEQIEHATVTTCFVVCVRRLLLLPSTLVLGYSSCNVVSSCLHVCMYACIYIYPTHFNWVGAVSVVLFPDY